MAGADDQPEQERAGRGALHRSASHGRLIRKLRHALGAPIYQALDDTSVVGIKLNPDGRLFVERLGQGMEILAALAPGAAEIIIRSVAHALQTEVDADQPIISGELPIGGHRFEGLLPPVVSSPTFTIRRRASRSLTSSGGGLPWEGPLQQIQESITGPVASCIALAAAAIAAAC